MFTGKWLQCLVRRFFLSPNPMILPQSICLTQVINDAHDRGDIELLELIAKNPQGSTRALACGFQRPR